MAERPRSQSSAGPLGRVPSGGLVLGAIASVQFGSSLAVTLFQRLGPGGTVLLRLCSAAIVLTMLWRPRPHGRSRRELLLVGSFGLVLAGMNLSFYAAADRIPLGIAVAVEFLGPLAVAVAGSRRRLDFLWIALAALGVLALTRGGAGHLDGLGLALALLAGCLWGAYILLNARLGQITDGSAALGLSMCVAAVVSLPFGIASAGAHLLEPESLALGSAVGILSSAIPYTLELEALRRLAPAAFGVLMSIEPAMAALAGYLVLAQGLGARELLGIALVVAASVGVSRRAAKPPLAV